MKYIIDIQKKAQKFIRKQSKENQQRLLNAIYNLPYEGDIKPLKGYLGLMRLRVGDFRVIYSVDNGQYIIYVIDAGNRGQIYNKY